MTWRRLTTPQILCDKCDWVSTLRPNTQIFSTSQKVTFLNSILPSVPNSFLRCAISHTYLSLTAVFPCGPVFIFDSCQNMEILHAIGVSSLKYSGAYLLARNEGCGRSACRDREMSALHSSGNRFSAAVDCNPNFESRDVDGQGEQSCLCSFSQSS